MADFLTTLTARTLGQLPSVMPRRTSHFEGDGASPPIDERDAVEAAELRRPPSEPVMRHDASSEPPARERAEPEDLGRTPEHEGTVDIHEPGVPAPAIEVIERQVVEREADEPKTIRRSSERPFPPVTAAPRPDDRPIDPVAREDREVMDTASLEPDRSREAASTPPKRQRPDAEEPLPATTEPIQVTSLDLGDPAREVPSERGDPHRVPTAILAVDREGEPSRRVEPEPSPQVTVTIGRIEVRAPPAPQASPPPRPKPHPQPPRMSLDDYLRRERGRR